MNKPLKELLSGFEFRIPDDHYSADNTYGGNVPDMDICDVVSDGRKIHKGCLFICCRDTNYNGPEYIKTAVGAGASVIVTEERLAGLSEDGQGPLYVYVQDARYAMAFIYAAWYDYPADKLTVIGITGTKGKTTTAYMLRDILQAAGHRTGLIGTVEYIIGDEHIDALNTTPESDILQDVLYRMVKAGLDIVVMEVSSTALMSHRSQGFVFDTGIFTNIGYDHIGGDECRDFDHYLYCKSLLFRQCRTGIVNADDPNIGGILEGHTCNIKTFGLSTAADLKAAGISYEYIHGVPGVSFDIEGYPQLHISVPMPGEYTVRNALGAVSAALDLGVSAEAIVQALAKIHVPGRTQIIRNEDDASGSLPDVIVDFAHNPMSMEALIKALRLYYKKRIICVFGCGGDLYKGKRALMGKTSTELADFTVITSDNPRFEDPEQIVKDIVRGISDDCSNYIVIPDRRDAVYYAVSMGGPGDVVALIGKGHEKYQDIHGVKYPWDDARLAVEALRDMNSKRPGD